MKPLFLLYFCFGISPQLIAQADDDSMQKSIAELRESVGLWHTETDFLGADGHLIRTVVGTYEFSWVIEDRVLVGQTQIPELQQAAGILFYINPKNKTIEMVSVGGDGKLWIMSGPLGGDQRTTQPFNAGNGQTQQLRFTRFNVTENTFESKMEITGDEGKTWRPGNRQRFKRIETPPK